MDDGLKKGAKDTSRVLSRIRTTPQRIKRVLVNIVAVECQATSQLTWRNTISARGNLAEGQAKDEPYEKRARRRARSRTTRKRRYLGALAGANECFLECHLRAFAIKWTIPRVAITLQVLARIIRLLIPYVSSNCAGDERISANFIHTFKSLPNKVPRTFDFRRATPPRERCCEKSKLADNCNSDKVRQNKIAINWNQAIGRLKSAATLIPRELGCGIKST